MRLSNLEKLAFVDRHTIAMEDWADDVIPRVLPAGWRKFVRPYLWYAGPDGVKVIFSARVEADEKRWVHVSLSRPERLPNWDDVRRVKDIFLGADNLAIQVLPRRGDYVNDHPFVLHLWRCLDGDPVPDFRTEGMI